MAQNKTTSYSLILSELILLIFWGVCQWLGICMWNCEVEIDLAVA